MYREYFGLNENPFSIAPDPRYLYLSEQHREALAHLLYGIESDGGFVLLTGEVGTGKTTICRCLLEQIPKDCEVAFIFNPKLTVGELLSTICDEFKIEYPADTESVKVFVDLINRYLLAAHASGHKAVLIIDEAQNLKADVLEQIRLLTNLETNQRKLLQIILLGQPELREKLSQPELRQLAQRIIARYHLGPLNNREASDYVTHRLTVAGARRLIFPQSTLHQLHRLSGGIPRLINVLCDRAMLGCYAQGKETVDKITLARAAKEVFGEPVGNQQPYRMAALWALAVILMLACGVLMATAYYRYRPETTDKAVTGINDQAQAERPRLDAPVQPKERTTASSDSAKGGAKEPPGPVLEQSPPAKENALPPAAAVDNEPDPGGNPGPSAVSGTVSQHPIKQKPEKSSVIGAARSPAAGAEPPIQLAELSWPPTEPIASSQALANSVLLKQWGIDSKSATSTSICQQAEKENLACLSGKTSLDGLRKFNRPAVLKVYDEQGREFQATLTDLGGDWARVAVGGKTLTVSVGEIALKWLGDYTLLWRMPPEFKGNLKLGARGAAVNWLRQALATAQKDAAETEGNDVFDEALAKRVKQFQLTNGLQPDGIVGPQTFILLNNAIGYNAPELVHHTKDD